MTDQDFIKKQFEKIKEYENYSLYLGVVEQLQSGNIDWLKDLNGLDISTIFLWVAMTPKKYKITVSEDVLEKIYNDNKNIKAFIQKNFS